jgi:hypothetical protein
VIPLLTPADDRNTPLRLAELWYARHSEVPLWMDILHYLEHGMIASTPACFAMAKVIEHKGEPVLFVRFASGSVAALVNVAPCYLSKIAFYRNNKGKLRVWPMDRAMALAKKRKKGD